MAEGSRRAGLKQGSRYVPFLVVLCLAFLVTVVVLPSALNIPQSNPSTVLEYAPIPSDSGSSSEGNLASLGLTSNRQLGLTPGEGSGLASSPAFGKGSKPTTKRCVGTPARQTEDPMSPPCVAFFEGDNGGATSRGVTKDEITVLVAQTGNGTWVTGDRAVQGPPNGSYCDLDKPPDTDPGCFERDTNHDLFLVRGTRSYLRYFNSRFQTYNRRVRYWIYFSGAGSEAVRRSAAADNIARVKPFAVLNQRDGYVNAYLEALASQGVMPYAFSWGSEGRPAEFNRRFAPLIWDFGPDIEHWAQSFISYACARIAPFPVTNADKGVLSNGQPMNGTPRRYGFISADEPSNPGLKYFAHLAKAGLKKCGIVPLAEATVPETRAGDVGPNPDDYQYSVNDIANFRRNDVTTIVWLGGYQLSYSAAGDAAKYYPEIVIAGDGVLDGTLFSKLQNQNWWSSVFGNSIPMREDLASPGYAACREGDPSVNHTDCDITSIFYRSHFMLFQTIQAAGPRLTPQAVDRGMHAFPRISSTSPYVASCYFDTGDYSCVKDSTEVWWDPSGVPPGKTSPGCYRLREGGKRFLPDKWSSQNFRKESPDPCTSFGALILP